MFTSRAEYRLSLREDNADWRLTEIGHQLGCVDAARWQEFERKRAIVSRETERLRSTWVNPRRVAREEALRVIGQELEHEYTLAELLRRPEVNYATLASLRTIDGEALGAPPPMRPEDAMQVEIQIKYAGYIARQELEVARHEHFENLALPAAIDYSTVRGLSIEVAQKLSVQRPETLGQAARISGVTPAAISLLLVHLKKRLGRGPLVPNRRAA
jgi:tRNA uridine 5-carboxymethylaminomethyl modification enzyme